MDHVKTNLLPKNSTPDTLIPNLHLNLNCYWEETQNHHTSIRNPMPVDQACHRHQHSIAQGQAFRSVSRLHDYMDWAKVLGISDNSQFQYMITIYLLLDWITWFELNLF